MRQLVAAVFGGALTTIVIPAGALAQCPDPVDQVLLFPESQTSGVPRNVVLRAEFPPTRDPHGTPHWRVLDDRGQQVEGETSWDGSTSTFTPTTTLGARRTYTARVTAQATGDFWQAAFATGSDEDSRAPSFDGATSVTWVQRSEEWLLENCRLARGSAFLFTIGLDDVSDDTTDRGDLCHSIYQTQGPGADESVPIARVRVGDDDEVTLFHAVEDGEGEFCFRVEVRDLAGRLDGNRREVCTEAIAGAIFDDICAAVGPRPRSGRLEAVFAVIAIALWLALRRGRR